MSLLLVGTTIGCDTCDYTKDFGSIEELQKDIGVPCPNCSTEVVSKHGFDRLMLVNEFVVALSEVDEDRTVKALFAMHATGDLDKKSLGGFLNKIQHAIATRTRPAFTVELKDKIIFKWDDDEGISN